MEKDWRGGETWVLHPAQLHSRRLWLKAHCVVFTLNNWLPAPGLVETDQVGICWPPIGWLQLRWCSGARTPALHILSLDSHLLPSSPDLHPPPVSVQILARRCICRCRRSRCWFRCLSSTHPDVHTWMSDPQPGCCTLSLCPFYVSTFFFSLKFLSPPFSPLFFLSLPFLSPFPVLVRIGSCLWKEGSSQWARLPPTHLSGQPVHLSSSSYYHLTSFLPLASCFHNISILFRGNLDNARKKTLLSWGGVANISHIFIVLVF